MLFEHTTLVYVLLPVIICLVVVSRLLRSRIKAREKEPLTCALKLLKMNTTICGAMFVFLWFSLPMTSSLSTFGAPRTVLDVQSGPVLLSLLQNYNRALVRTTDVLNWFLFAFVWWFLTSYYDFAKAISETRRQSPEVKAELH
jgi:hypothetical protein